MIVQTKCNDCVFLDGQSCKLNRIKKLEIDNINENGDITLKRFCNTYRPESWLNDLSLEESEDIQKTVLREIQPRVGFFVILNTESENAIQELDQTLNNIKNQTINARYVIVITDKVEYNPEIQKLLIEKFDFDTTNYHIVQILERPQIAEMLIDMSFRHAKNGWAYVCNAGENIDEQLIEKMHKRVNIDLKRLVIIKPYDTNMNGLLFQTSLFKFLNGNNVKVFQDTVTDNRSFMDKVLEAAKNSSPDTLIDWETFNNDA